MNSDEVPELTPEMLQANPGLAFCLILFTGIFFLAVAGTLTTWVVLGMRFFKGQEILPAQPWTPRPWGFAEICLTFLCLLFAQILMTALAPAFGIDMNIVKGTLESDDPVPLSFSSLLTCGYLVAVALLTAWVMLR
ncbi:MAG: hypothetical protein AAF483_27425, partial [Planctomycetota bacterium]